MPIDYFLPASTSPSLNSFSGCVRCWFFFHRSRPSLTSISGCAHRWFFPRLCRSLTSFSVCAHCWFFTGFRMSLFSGRTSRSLTFFSCCAFHWHLSQVAPVAEFFSELRPLLTSFSGCAHRWIFLRLDPSLIFSPKFPMSLKFLPGTRAHKSVADFYFSLRTSLNFSQVAPLADFAPGYTCRRFFSPIRTSPSLTSFSGCFRRWHFSQVNPVADFYFRLRTPLTFTQVAPSQIFPQVTQTAVFSGSHDSVADFLLRLRTSLTFYQVTHVADYFFLVARFRRWPLVQILPVDDFFFTGRASHNFFFKVALVAVIFFQVVPIDDFCQLARVLRWLLFQVEDIAVFSQLAPVADFSKLWLSLIFLAARASPSLTSFFWGCARRWNFSHLAPVADFYFRLRTLLTFFPGRTRCWFSPRLRTSLIFFPGRTIPSLTSFSDCARRWLIFHGSPMS